MMRFFPSSVEIQLSADAVEKISVLLKEICAIGSPAKAPARILTAEGNQ
jgi:hypothetical protein